MLDNQKISPYQFSIFVALYTIGSSLFFYVSLTTKHTKQDI